MSGLRVNVGTEEATAVVQIDSTTQGVLFPRMTTTERDAISSPATGLVIFNTTTTQLEEYTGSAWMSAGTGGVSELTDLSDVSAAAQTANYVMAAGDGASGGDYRGRALVAADIPALAASQVTSGALAHEQGGLEADVSAYGGLPLISSGSTSELKLNLSASAAPTATDDSSAGYAVGSRWVDTANDKEYVCLDATASAAVWTETTAASGGSIGGSTGSTDNAILRADGTGGSTVQAAAPTIDDSGNLDLSGGEIRDYTEQVATDTDVSGSISLDWSAASLIEHTLTDNVTYTFSNVAAGRSLTLIITQDSTGGRTITWPSAVKWAGGSAPTLSTGAGAVDVVTLVCRADGSTVLGFPAGLNFS